MARVVLSYDGKWTQDVSIIPTFSRGNSFPRFPAPAQTGIHGSVFLNSRRNGLKEGLVGRGRKTGEWKTARNGVSLVARNSTRAFLEFSAARGYENTNFARTFP